MEKYSSKTGVKIILLAIAICSSLSFSQITSAAATGSGDEGSGGSSSGVAPPPDDRGKTDAGIVPSSFNLNFLKADGQEQKYLEVAKDGKTGTPIAAFIIQIINFIAMTVGSLAFLALVAGGFVMMTSHGSENQLTKAKEIIKYAITGLAITLSAYYIILYVQRLFFEI